jgi:hypothetical protein
MAVVKRRGNPNPSPATRFKPGQVGNPSGKTGLQREMEIRNAQIATEIRGRLLDAVKATLQEDTSTENALARIEANVLKLLKDSEERGLGAPKASVDLTNSDGSLKSRQEDAVLDALTKIHGNQPPT